MIKFLLSNKAWKVLSICIAVWGLIYFGCKIYTSDFNLFFLSEKINNNTEIFLIEIFLLCFNFFCEAKKWQSLRSLNQDKIKLSKCLTISLQATAFGNSTFLGVGEHVARANEENERKTLLTESVLSSIMQTTVICLCGILSVGFTPLFSSLFQSIIAIITTIFILVALLYIFRKKIEFFLSEKINLKRENINKYQILNALRWNIIRFLTFSYQLYLFIHWSYTPKLEIITLIFIYYFIITIIPSFHLIDIGVKGSVALFTFKTFASESCITEAILLIWILNTLIPTLVGFALFFFEKINRKAKKECSC